MTDLAKLTINLTLRGAAALEQMASLTGDNKTDITNRSLQITAYLEEIAAKGGAVYVRESQGAELERLRLF